MTQNQIAYWKLQEEMRANRKQEEIKDVEARTKQVEADTNRSQLEEAKRHNMATEANQKTGVVVKGVTDTLATVAKVLTSM